jgi:hypothetical protein
VKDHEIAQLVNDLRDIAKEFHSAQQLRERIAIIVRKALTATPAPPVVSVTDKVAERIHRHYYLSPFAPSKAQLGRQIITAVQSILGPTLGMISREEHAAAVELAYMDGHSDCDHERSVWHVSTDWRDSEARKRLEAP